jgi:hypothetical protein
MLASAIDVIAALPASGVARQSVERSMNRVGLAARLGALVLLGGVTCGVARADDFPPRKPGLWQIDMSMPGGHMPPQQMKMCIDAATDAAMYKLGMSASQGMCDKPDITRSGSTVTVNSACKMGESHMNTHAITKFTGDTAYHTDASTKIDPPMAGRSESAVMQDATWVGQCPADMRPGDVVMGNGMKMNMKQMLSDKP